MVFEATVIYWLTRQLNAAGEWKRPEALGLGSGAPSTIRNWRDEEVSQKKCRFHGGEPRDIPAAQ